MVVLGVKGRDIGLEVPITIKYSGWCELFQMNSHHITIDEYRNKNLLKEINDKRINYYLICLPLIDASMSVATTINGDYYIIESNWMEVNEDTNITMATSY